MPKATINRLEWKKYSWSDFEQICFEYTKTIYSQQFYKTTWTKEKKDGGRDIIINALKGDFIAWGECKNHQRSVDLSVIGKNVVLAISRKINKAIFFSVSNITLSTKIEIINVAQSHGFDVMFLDGTQLDEAILSCEPVAKKYFREAYESRVLGKQGDIIIRTVLSEYEHAEDSFDYEKEHYNLSNGFEIYLHIFIKNLSNIDVPELKAELLPGESPDIIFYGCCETTVSLKGFSDYLWTLKGLVLSSSNNINIPALRIQNTTTDDIYEKASGTIDASNIWLVPFVGEKVSEFLQEELLLLQNAVLNGYPRCIFVRGKSGMGKSRLIQEIGNKCNSYGFRALVFDFRSKSENEVFRELLLKILCIPISKFKSVLTYKEFQSVIKKYSFGDKLKKELYDFLFRGIELSNYQTLVDILFVLTANPIGIASILIAFDNVQELSSESQLAMWNYIERLKTVQAKVLIILTENVEMRRKSQNYLLKYLDNSGLSDSNNFISSYECSALEFPEAIALLQSMLTLSDDSSFIVKRIIKIVGCRPLDILFTAKTLIKEDGILIKEGRCHRFHDMGRCNTFLRTLPDSLESIIEYRYKNYLLKTKNPEDLEQIFALLVLFDGKISSFLVHKLGLNVNILNAMKDDMILKKQIPEDLWMFYHDSLFSFHVKHKTIIDETTLSKVIDMYEMGSNECISNYVYLKSLIALSRRNKAIEFAVRLSESYYSKHELHNTYKIAALILPLINKEKQPLMYFDVLHQQAQAALEAVNNEAADKLFELLYDHVLINGSALGMERIAKFYHHYSNSKLHTLQYDKALSALLDFSHILRDQSWNHRIRIENRLCVAYFSLSQRKEALKHINTAIRLAEDNNDIFWLSTSYSDKAYTYFFMGRGETDRKKATTMFNNAVKYHEMCIDTPSYRSFEILIQKALSCSLTGDYIAAAEAIDRAVSETIKAKYYYLLIPALNFKSYLHIRNGEFETAKRVLQESLSYANIFSINKSSIAIYMSLGIISVLKHESYTEECLEYFLSSARVLKGICKPENSFRFHSCIANLLRIYVETEDNVEAEKLLAEYTDARLREHYKECRTLSSSHNGFENMEFGMLNYRGWSFLY